MKRISDCIIYDYDELRFDDTTSGHIAGKTVNTWQKNRGDREKLGNTRQGKLAEAAVKAFFDDKRVCYIDYDDFRRDDFDLHAPLDGLLYSPEKTSEQELNSLLDSINNEVAAGNYGHISPELREELRRHNVFTVEIKSTRINEKKIQAARFRSYDNDYDLQRLIAEICRDDFLTYPKYARSGDYTWESYCQFVKGFESSLSALTGKDLSDAVKNIELSHMDDYYIRVYMDETNKKAIILGYITKNELMNPPTTKKMVLYGKSEKALYLTQPLTARTPIEKLEAYFPQ